QQLADVASVGNTSQIIAGIFDPVDTLSDGYSGMLTNLTKSNLSNQQINSFSVLRGNDGVYRVPSGKFGFYLTLATSITVTGNDFINPVGMVTNPAANVRGTLIFSTFLPSQGQCSVGGYGFIHGVNFRTGGGSIIDTFVDENNPFYNGGIGDINSDNSYNSLGLEA